MHPVRSVQWPQESRQTNSNQLTEKIIGAALESIGDWDLVF